MSTITFARDTEAFAKGSTHHFTKLRHTKLHLKQTEKTGKRSILKLMPETIAPPTLQLGQV